MNFPSFCYSTDNLASHSTPLLSSDDAFTVHNSLADRIRLFTSYIDDASEVDLYNFLIELVHEIFGRGPAKGWTLDKIKPRVNNVQNYMSLESDCIFSFLCNNGYIFKLCYKLISNSLFKFNLYFSDIPVELKQKIEKSYIQSYYGSRFLYHSDSNVPIGLYLNSFEYYMFHFILYGLKLPSDDILTVNDNPSEQSVYVLLCLDYINSFLPSSSSTVLPELQYNIISTISHQKQCRSPRKLLNFIKKDVACNEFSNNKVEDSWILTSEATWRSELVAFLFADIWLTCNAFDKCGVSVGIVKRIASEATKLCSAEYEAGPSFTFLWKTCKRMPSMTLTKLIRCFIKQLHLYSNQNVTHNINLTARHGTKIYHYLIYYMDNWQQDFSFRVFLENWLCFIQPWRYDSLDKKRYYSSTESEINEKWKMFIVRNLQCYTKLFSIVIKRFLSINICSVQYSMMVLRVLKVFNHPYLLKIILDIEHMYVTNEPQYKKWNMLLSDCLRAAEGPMFKYELMFSKERSHEYKLFFAKLQKSLDHADVEISRFQENNISRDRSSFLELMLSPRSNKISDYSLSEWEEIQTNLKSSLIFMEQIINMIMNNTTKDDSSEWSTCNISNTMNLFSRNNSFTFERSTINSSSRKKELEIDPDYLETLNFENHFLVKFSKYLRSIVERYWHSHVMKFSVENTIFAGVLRQALIRPPLKIHVYEARLGYGKRVRTPKIVPPTVSFRWIASYFTLTWIFILLTLIWAFNKSLLWIGLYYVFRIIYWCIKYLIGHAPPFKCENFH